MNGKKPGNYARFLSKSLTLFAMAGFLFTPWAQADDLSQEIAQWQLTYDGLVGEVGIQCAPGPVNGVVNPKQCESAKDRLAEAKAMLNRLDPSREQADSVASKKDTQASGKSLKAVRHARKASSKVAKKQSSNQDSKAYWNQNCSDPKKVVSRYVQSKCQEIQDQDFMNSLATFDPNTMNVDVLRSLYQAWKSKFTELDKRLHDLQKKNGALARQASQSCSVASQPLNEVKRSTGLSSTSVGEAGDNQIGEVAHPSYLDSTTATDIAY